MTEAARIIGYKCPKAFRRLCRLNHWDRWFIPKQMTRGARKAAEHGRDMLSRPVEYQGITATLNEHRERLGISKHRFQARRVARPGDLAYALYTGDHRANRG